MKKHLPTILTVVACILAAFCLMRVLDLEQQVNRMNSDLSGDINLLRDSVNGISGNIRDAIEQQANLLSSTAYEFSDPKDETRSVTLKYTVTPKQYHPEQTELTLVSDVGNHPMQYQDGSYTATFEVPLFGTTVIQSVLIEQDGVITTQRIDEYLAPREQFVPTVHANYSGSSTVTRKNGSDSAIKTYQGNVTIDIKQTPIETAIRSVEIWEWMDGEIFAKTELSLNKQEAWESSGLERPTEDADAVFPAHYSHSLKGYKLEIPYGSAYEMVVAVTEQSGRMHRIIVDRVEIDAAGDVQKSQVDWYNDSAYVYAPDGECIYEPEYERIG